MVRPTLPYTLLQRLHENTADTRYAPNAITLPTLDLFSCIPSASILLHPLRRWAYWRGRYGCTVAQQADLWAQIQSTFPSAAAVSKPADNAVHAEAKRAVLRFRTFDGEMREVGGRVGESVLEVGKRGGLEALEGVCGGNLGGSGVPALLSRNPLLGPYSPSPGLSSSGVLEQIQKHHIPHSPPRFGLVLAPAHA